MKRSRARRDALSLFLEAPPRRPAKSPAGPVSPVDPGDPGARQAQAPSGNAPSISRPGFRTPCSRVLEWFVAESRCLTRLAGQPGARGAREGDVHTTSTRQAAPIRPPRALPLPDAGPGPVPGPGA